MPSSIPDDPYSTERSAIARKRMLAQALQQGAMAQQPTQQIGGVAIRNSPLQGLSQIAQALVSRNMSQGADSAEKDLAGQMQARRGADMSLLASALGGRQASAGGLQEDASGNVTQMDPVKALSPAQTLQQSLPMIQDPQLQQFGLQAQQGAMQRQEQQAFNAEQKEADRVARTQDRILALDAASQNASSAREERAARAKEADALRRDLAGNADKTRRDLAAQAAAARAEAAAAKPLNESQGNAVLFGSRAAVADQVLQDLEGNVSAAGIAASRFAENAPVIGGLTGAISNTVLSEDAQRVKQAQRDFVNAVLRKESGASIAPSEFANAIQQYFPAAGDRPEVIKQKRQNRATALAGLRSIAGPGASQIEQIIANTPRLTKKNDVAKGEDFSPELQSLLDQYAPQ